jgi:hydroxyethylthiazole kinase-like uncharacterized protein yjeF
VTPLADLLDRTPLVLPDGGKDERGTLVIVGGPPSCPGAVVLAGSAALRVGGGRVQLVVDPTMAAATAMAMPEALVLSWDQRAPAPQLVLERLADADAVVLGPGHDRAVDLMASEVASALDGAPLVLDAGFLSCATDLAARVPLVIAPNASEAATLCGRDAPVEDLAKDLAAELGRPTAVRGDATAVADRNGQVWRLDDSPEGLGTPGSGDVLIGVLGSLLARGMDALAALAWAVELHARAGAILAARTPVGFLAREIAATLPHAVAASDPVTRP